MAAIFADHILNCIFQNENDIIPIQISLKSVPRNRSDNKSALVQVIAWRRTDAKPFPEQKTTQFIGAYMRHRGGGWVNLNLIDILRLQRSVRRRIL